MIDSEPPKRRQVRILSDREALEAFLAGDEHAHRRIARLLGAILDEAKLEALCGLRRTVIERARRLLRPSFRFRTQKLESADQELQATLDAEADLVLEEIAEAESAFPVPLLEVVELLLEEAREELSAADRRRLDHAYRLDPDPARPPDPSVRESPSLRRVRARFRGALEQRLIHARDAGMLEEDHIEALLQALCT